MADAEAIQKYPPYVTTAEDRERWDLCRGLCEAIFGGDGEAAVWGATRVMFNSNLTTSDSVMLSSPPAAE